MLCRVRLHDTLDLRLAANHFDPQQSRSSILDEQSALEVYLMRCASARLQRDYDLNGDLAPYPKIAGPWT